jgi:hypothetical protein
MNKNNKELKKPQMIRIPNSLKVAVQESADKHNKGNWNQELRDLIQIGLKSQQRDGKKEK